MLERLKLFAAKLIDPFGREVAIPRKPITDSIIPVRVRDQWMSYPSNGLTPQKLASILKEADIGHIERQAELATEIEEKDLDLAAHLQTRKLAVTGLDWEITPASDNAEDKTIADHVRENLIDLDFNDALFDLLDAIFKGFATIEITWSMDSDRSWLSGLSWMPQTRWTFANLSGDYNSQLDPLPRLLTDAEPVRGIEIPPWKIVYHRHKARSGFASRAGLFRPIIWFYLFKNYAIKDWIVFLEKYGQPLRLGKYTAGASKDDLDILKQAVRDLGTDAGAVISETTMIEILEAKAAASSTDGYKQLTEYIDRGYAKGILGQTASSQGTPGKLGNEDAQNDVRQDILEADCRALAKTLRDQIIWPIVGFNFGWDKLLPSMRFACEPPEDQVQMAATHKTLVEMGAPIPVSFIQRKYNIPEPIGDEPILELRQVPSPLGFNVLADKKKVHIPLGSRQVEL